MHRHELYGTDIFTIPDFLTPQECADFVAAAEAAGFGDAPISTSVGMVMRKDIRNNDRVMIDDVPLAARLYDRLRPLLPPNFRVYEPCGLNERFRHYRYGVGQKFDWHMDGAFARDTGERSRLTFMLYLNDGFVGGETVFNTRRLGAVRGDDETIAVTPVAGTALLFRHDVLHTGAVVIRGVKYVMRSDVMYRLTPE